MSTKIEWADRVWNPVTGCTKISEGCKNCYAEGFAKRLQKNPNKNIKHKYRNCFEPTFHMSEIREHPEWKPGEKIFVCSMGDLFHEKITMEQMDWALGLTVDYPENIFIILTKRPQIALNFYVASYGGNKKFKFPDNIWIGVSVENQKTADERIPILLQIPAKVRFISVEPMLGHIDFYTLMLKNIGSTPFPYNQNLFIDWVICGGESGHGARPMHPDWVRLLRDQCKSANVPFFFKGWNEWTPIREFDDNPQNLNLEKNHYLFPDLQSMYKIGKKQSGRLIDGVEYLEFPKM